MKSFPLRKDIETYDICLCGHKNSAHEFRFIEIFMIFNNSFTGKCHICTCPKYKKETTMLKTQYDKLQNPNEVEHK